MIAQPHFSVEPWAVRETRARPRRARADRVGLRALQRPHRAARQPRRGRAVRHARHLPELLLRAAPAALRRGRLRLPGVGPDDRQRHQRQDHPAARRRRAVRRPLRHAGLATSATLDLRAGRAAPRGPSGARRRAAGRVRSARLVSFAQRAVAAIRYEVEPLDGETRIVVQSELVANEAVPGRAAPTRGRPPRWRSPLVVRVLRHPRAARRAGAPHAGSGLRMAAGDGPRGRRAARARSPRPRAAPTSRA